MRNNLIKQALVILLTLVMTLTMMPALAFAGVEAQSDNESAAAEVQNEDETSGSETGAEPEADNSKAAASDETSDDTSATLKQEEPSEEASPADEAAVQTEEASAAEKAPVKYLDSKGVEQTVTDYTVVNKDNIPDRIGAGFTSGWYVVESSNIEYSNRLTVVGDVHLVLCDNSKMKADSGIRMAYNADRNTSLTIYGQSNGDKMGKLESTGTDRNSGIGGNEDEDCGRIVVNGGYIHANGGEYASGIGGGDEGTSNDITINNGHVIATGGYYGAGIGGGDKKSSIRITINGGEVGATGGSYGAGIGGGNDGDGGSITINGGTVQGYGGIYGAGIGGGDEGGAGTILINAGRVIARAGNVPFDLLRPNTGGAAIGGGCEGDAGYISIKGGTVTATSWHRGAGIGSGADATKDIHNPDFEGGEILISGGHVEATADMDDGKRDGNNHGGAGIGSGVDSNGVYVRITGGYVSARASSYTRTGNGYEKGSAAIGNGYSAESRGKVEITGGTVDARTVNPSEVAVGAAAKSDSCDVIISRLTRVSKSSGPVAAADRLSTMKGHDSVRIEECSHDKVEWTITDTTHTKKCTNCEYDVKNEPHRFGDTYKYDDAQHWKVCSECGYESTHVTHDFVDGECVCGIKGMVQKISFEKGTGSGTMDPVWWPSFSKYTLPAETTFNPPEGLKLIGWKHGSELYDPGAQLNIYDHGVTVTAVFGLRWEDLQETIDKAKDGDTIKLSCDFKSYKSTDKALKFPAGKSLTLDLNGYVINRNAQLSSTNANAITVNGNLTIKDSSADGSGKITGGVNIKGMGGGVIVNNGAVLDLKSGSISENIALMGAGVYVNTGGTFNMSGGSVSGNMCIASGGGVQNFGGTFDMSGGSITGNNSFGQFGATGTGVAITGTGKFSISGSPVIRDNQCVARDEEGDGHLVPDDVTLPKDASINVSGNLNPDAYIGLSMYGHDISGDNTYTFTQGFKGETGYRGMLSCFASNTEEAYFGIGNDGELLASSKKAEVRFEAGEGGSGKMSNVNVAANTKYIAPPSTFTPPDGKVFDEWNASYDGQNSLTASSRQEIEVKNGVTLTAKWKVKTAEHSIAINAGEGGKAYASAGSARKGDEVDLIAIPDTGYQFAEWKLSTPEATATIDDVSGKSAVLTMGDENIIIDAKFSEVRATGVTLSDTELELGVGESGLLTAIVAPSDAYNKTVSWTDGHKGEFVRVDETGKVTAKKTGNTTVTATTNDGGFKAVCNVTVVDMHTVTFEPDNGSAASSVKVRDAHAVDEPVKPARNGYSFVAWRQVIDGETSFSDYDFSTPVRGDITLKAIWKHTEHNNTTMNMTAAVEPSCEEPGNTEYWTCTVCGRHFSDANGEHELEEDAWVVEPTGHEWTGRWYMLDEDHHYTLCKNNSEHMKEEAHSWDDGIVIVEPTYTRKGLRRYTCSVCNGTKDEEIPEKERVDSHSITVTTDGNGTARASADKAVQGETVILTASSNPNYRFSHWEVVSGGVTINDGIFVMGNKDVEVKACFEKGQSGSIQSARMSETYLSIPENKTRNLSVSYVPNDESLVQSIDWASRDSSIAMVYKGVVTARKPGSTVIVANVRGKDGSSATATCEVNVVSASVPVSGISVSRTQLTVEEGETAAVTAVITPGNATNQSVSWARQTDAFSFTRKGKVATVKGEKADGQEHLLTVTSNEKKPDGSYYYATCTVKVVPKKYKVTFTDGLGNKLKEEMVEKGMSATAPADPVRRCYTFAGWDKDFSYVTSELTVNAKWEADGVPVCVEMGKGHEASANTLAKFINMASPSSASLDKTRVTVLMPASLNLGETEDRIRDFIHNAGISSGAGQIWSKNVGLKPVSEYTTEEDFKQYENSRKDEPLEKYDSGLDVYAHWVTPVSAVKLTVKEPACGTVIKDNGGRTPDVTPEITDNSGYAASIEAVWQGKDVEGLDPYFGTLKGGTQYASYTVLIPKYGYTFDATGDKPAAVTVNGASARVKSLGSGMITALPLITAQHKWSGWKTVKPASVGVNGLEQRTCSACSATESRTIPAIQPAPPAVPDEIYDPSIPNVKSFKAKAAKKSFRASWKKQSKKNLKKFANVEIQYSQDGSFAKNATSSSIKGKKKTSLKVKKLEKKSVYFVRARNIKYVGGVKYVGNWSKTKRVKIK